MNKYSLKLANRQCKICKERKPVDNSRHGYNPTWFVCGDCIKQNDRPVRLLLKVKQGGKS